MPECTILAKLTKDSADTKFRACGVFNVVYIVVTKLEVGAADEHLDDVAQLIAEVEGMYVSLLILPRLDIFYNNNRL